MLALIGLALQAAPLLVKWLGGEKAAEGVAEVTKIAENIFQSADPQAIEKKIAADPNLYVQWQTKLGEWAAQKEQNQHEERLEEFKNVVNARANYPNAKNVADSLAKVTVWAFFLINTSVIAAIFYMLIYGAPGVVTKNVELAMAAWGMINAILGWLNSKADVVYNFFLGGSSGSNQKNEMFSQALNKLATSLVKK